jgi:hypothetical protein
VAATPIALLRSVPTWLRGRRASPADGMTPTESPMT